MKKKGKIVKAARAMPAWACKMFFDSDNDIFYQWVAECRSAGINCLIIPGIMPILGYDRFQRMLKFTKTKVPEKVFLSLDNIKNDDE